MQGPTDRIDTAQDIWGTDQNCNKWYAIRWQGNDTTGDNSASQSN